MNIIRISSFDRSAGSLSDVVMQQKYTKKYGV